MSNSFRGTLRHLTIFLLGTHRRHKNPHDEPPLQAELFSAGQMEQHGKSLASTHRLSLTHLPDQLLGRLDENEDILLRTCSLLRDTVKVNRRITPAAEWLLDNFYLIEEQIFTAKRHLPKRYSSELPNLVQGPSAGLPRVYDIALETISHGDGRVDPESFSCFVAAYQKSAALTLGELWAIPIMLRLALIENLRRVGTRVAASTTDRDHADVLADQMIEVAKNDPKNLILVVADMARSNPPMTGSFVAELARRLQGQSAALALPLTWIEHRLSESGVTIEQLVQSETQMQASRQVSISNSISSLRFLGEMDWREFVETMSGVEQKLRQDPSGHYGTMDFTTRDRYRHVIENLAKGSPLSEHEIADKAIQLAHQQSAITKRNDPFGAGFDRTSHVGYYLIDKGLPQLKQAVGARLTIVEALLRAGRRFPLTLYLGTISALTLIFTASLLAMSEAGSPHGSVLILVAILLVFCTSHLAIVLVNWVATLFATPHVLPRIDLSGGIPPEFRTLVAIPTMITSVKNIEHLIEDLEVRFLANRDSNLLFGLLTDFRDAQEETLPEDESLLAVARNRIGELNQKYRSAESDAFSDTFFLFHRPRRWNALEQLWMGYERKRGKLADLNALLRGGGKERFSCIEGTMPALSFVKYVITLDTDTQLPRDSARQLVGAMAHPLNRPQLDDRQLVAEGYGILQPRMAVSLPGTNRSRYARLFGSEPGIDPYSRAVSDVYQDVFSEGSFIGKGIYDIDAFEQSLNGRLPENRILSHDLLEGCFARAGLLSDVQLYEDYPSSYSADVSRRHRWIRGDWQIASWILRRIPGDSREFATGSVPNPLSLLSQWKIFDNLRRSLTATALMLLMLLGWTVLLPAWYWTLVVIGIILLQPLSAAILDLIRKPDDMLPGQHLTATLRASAVQFQQAAFTLACLPHEAYFGLDAVIRTNWRFWVTRKKLLEWASSGSLERDHHNSLIACYQSMWTAPVIAIATTIYLAVSTPEILATAGPILFLWIASPAIAWWLSQPIVPNETRLTADQIIFLRKTSRKTWAFFETFVGPEDNWLPPDNFQNHPVSAIAHRTSPTNIGLALLANLSAYDFCYITMGSLIERTTHTLSTMARLTRHRGHFFNWYDTQSLQTLSPKYVSTVDSGNLAGHLLTLRPGLLALPQNPVLGARLFHGLSDTVRVLIDIAVNTSPATQIELERLQEDLQSACKSRPATLAATRSLLASLTTTAEKVATSLDGAFSNNTSESGAQWWAQTLTRQCRSAADELTLFAPWLALPSGPGRLRDMPLATDIPTLRDLATLDLPWLSAIKKKTASDATPEELAWLDDLLQTIATARSHAVKRMLDIESLAQQAGAMAVMDYDFLYDKARHLLAIGYNVDERRRDSSYYDLLASEARLSSFVGIAQGQLPQESWFALGRLLTNAAGKTTLLSWSGSMFEYLMPMLVMPTYEDTLLDQTCKAAVERQVAYGKQHGVAWGVSESGYNAVDAALNYQYRAFGVPGLGLKRGLSDDLVIAPYASALALMVAPEAACLNLQRLADEGLAGPFGFYEAIDYTTSRLPRGQTSALIHSFMAHHQGMIFLSLAYLILDRPMQKRFESEPMFQATTLLLQERVPRIGSFQLHAAEFSNIHTAANDGALPVRVLSSPNTAIPEVQLLSNGRYHVMVTNAGGGYSRWKDLAVTRWREDTTCDNWGTFCYIRDVASGAFWSNTHQPTLKQAKTYEAIFTEGRVEFRRHDLDYDTYTEIVVSPEDDIELRRVRIRNRARTRRTIEVTSYAEVVLAAPAADALHPAFSNLFVQTEIVPEDQAILCTRRPRSPGEQPLWMFHQMTVRGAGAAEISYETDRMRFIGRGRTVASPLALGDCTTLSGSEGSVLDPIVAIRYRIILEPEQVATIDMVTGITSTREAALSLAVKYQDRPLADRVFDLAWTHGQVVLRQINGSEADAQLYARLAGSVIYANSSLRADAVVLKKNRRGQSGLWGYAISGDLPIVLLQIGEHANIDLVRQLVQAHAYWRLKGLSVDLVIWNEDRAGYRQSLHDQIMGMIAAGVETHVIDRPGGVFVRPAEQISDEDRVLVQSVARAIISDRRGTLDEQLNRHVLMSGRTAHLNFPRLKSGFARRTKPAVTAPLSNSSLLFNNGRGGFSPDGREYIITTSADRLTPAPWVNVLANAHFGTVVSESGAAYTWNDNAHEFRLTPWGNDPVSDPSGEAFYLRDEENGDFWSPTPLPCRGATPYVTRHGFGYSSFEHTEDGISSELTVFVALDAAVKFSILKVCNNSGRTRRLTATGYVEWVLGDLRPKSSMHVITEIDPMSGALFARNAYNTEFADRIAFFDVDDTTRTYSGDRAEFIGRNGTLENPAAMKREQLSNQVGAAFDPCAAIQVTFELADGEEREINFRLGVAGRRDADDASKLVRRFRGTTAARNTLVAVRKYWTDTLGAVQVETPDQSLNLLANGWLVYQTLACRLWARSGYYQSGGAFGYRDQLQDVMALVHTEPALMREHLLRCAAHQFREGDVQHWWHPISDRGVRTHCSDDYLWLPLAICRYVLSTGDTGVLDETVSFLDGRAVNPEEDSYYDLPGHSDESASLYQHGVRAILKGINFGAHGLPLIGSGDWNDGMNLVGADGKGESVWLGFFLYDVLMKFVNVAQMKGDTTFSDRCRSEAVRLRENIERSGWDGEWYRRAYFDDGTPLGSADSVECQIDSVAQSWSVLSGASDLQRSRMAMEAVDQRLVLRAHGLVQLLDPPFDKTAMNPGYIKGYVPGVRENGGQYTHGAIWAVMAFAALGDSRRAWELFNMVNPIRHSSSDAAISIYKVEPYVVAADVYAVAPHTGRGGWTWYTGSAGWMYRLILESLLGLKLQANKLSFSPCLPADWDSFKVHYRFRETQYHISVLQSPAAENAIGITLDGIEQTGDTVSLVNDRLEHAVEIRVHRHGG